WDGEVERLAVSRRCGRWANIPAALSARKQHERRNNTGWPVGSDQSLGRSEPHNFWRARWRRGRDHRAGARDSDRRDRGRGGRICLIEGKGRKRKIAAARPIPENAGPQLRGPVSLKPRRKRLRKRRVSEGTCMGAWRQL